MTVAQAAELCECSPKTLRRAIDAGQLSAIRLGLGPKSDRIHPDDLEAFWKKARFQPVQVRLPSVLAHPPSHHDDELQARLDRLLGRGRKKR
ncbi:helix-turn-helix domain-containing protein [Pseudomonas sp. CGJS7]|uniref:helix-turn-helix domain-containing protein n=1 Tax=Pseudomonas sp. CGJS7 TaxID=3109348 RepID=UPI003FA7C2D5